MKFSKRRKSKMRKINQRRINRVCKDMIGHIMDYELKETIIDQAKIENTMYFLTQNMYYQCAIYKIFKVNGYVKLSVKRLLKNKEDFMKHENWYKDSEITINQDGEIEFISGIAAE